MTNLSQNYRQYIKLQNAIRFNPEKENVGMLLQEIQEPGHALTDFEKEYATWTQSLWDRINIDAVKTEIKRLATKLRQEKDEKIQHMPKATESLPEIQDARDTRHKRYKMQKCEMQNLVNLESYDGF